jgi:phage portal protein BeeE
LGRLEVAFETVNQFLSAHRFAGKLASNSVVQYALWLNEVTPVQHERLIRWWQDEIEGTGRVPLLSCEQKPEVLRFGSGSDSDLRLAWQNFLLQMIANAFDLPPMLLGVTGDVNRSTAGEMADEAFRSGIAPVAKLLAEHITRDLFSKRLGWGEFEFVFNDLESRNEQEEVQMQTALLQAGVLTVDEVRGMRGLGPMSRGQGPGVREGQE